MSALRVARRTALGVAAAGLVSSCAAIWGFQDAVDMRDAGEDATAADVQEEAAPLDGTVEANAPETSEGGSLSDGASPEGAADVAAGDAGGDGGSGSDAGYDAADADAGGQGDGAIGDGALADADAAPAEGGGDGGSCPTVCVTVPAGWQGPLEIFEATGAPPPAPPSCAGNYATDVYDGLGSPDAGPASCTRIIWFSAPR